MDKEKFIDNYFSQEIKKDSMSRLDNLHIEFLEENKSLTFEEIVLVRSVFEFIKERN